MTASSHSIAATEYLSDDRVLLTFNDPAAMFAHDSAMSILAQNRHLTPRHYVAGFCNGQPAAISGASALRDNCEFSALGLDALSRAIIEAGAGASLMDPIDDLPERAEALIQTFLSECDETTSYRSDPDYVPDYWEATSGDDAVLSPRFIQDAIAGVAALNRAGIGIESLAFAHDPNATPVIAGGSFLLPEDPPHAALDITQTVADYRDLAGVTPEDRRFLPAVTRGHRSRLSIMEQWISSTISGVTREGEGSDGIVFSLPGQDAVLKTFITNPLDGDTNGIREIASLKALSENSARHLIPTMMCYGYVGPMLSIVREDLTSIDGALSGIMQDDYLEQIMATAMLMARGERHWTGDELDNEIAHAIHDATTDPDLVDCDDAFLSRQFVCDMIDLHRAANAAGIIIGDLHNADQFGRDAHGRLKVRDLSRFIPEDERLAGNIRRSAGDITSKVISMALAGQQHGLAPSLPTRPQPPSTGGMAP